MNEVRDSRAELVLVSKWFPRASLIRSIAVPVVYRLHNYMPLCMAGTFSRDGRLCLDCQTTSALPGIVHKCYRGRTAWSVAAGAIHQYQRSIGILPHCDSVVFPSYRARDLVLAGLPGLAGRSAVVPHFVPEPGPEAEQTPKSGHFLYVGQLEPYKGLGVLLEHWPDNLPLRVVGNGSMAGLVAERAKSSQITLVGRLDPKNVAVEMASARALIITSPTPETFGRVHAEGCSVGTPTAAVAGTAVADEVQRLGTGAVFSSVEDLVGSVAATSWPDPDHLRRAYRHNYSAKRWVALMEDVFRGVVNRAAADG
jgi:glycosyltransferase involved in cell wall biosynthesis